MCDMNRVCAHSHSPGVSTRGKVWCLQLPCWMMKLLKSTNAFRCQLKTFMFQSAYGRWETDWFLFCNHPWSFSRVRAIKLLCYFYCVVSVFHCVFSALTLLVGWQEGHPACKNWVVGCWGGYLSWPRYRLVYGPADATATHCILLQ